MTGLQNKDKSNIYITLNQVLKAMFELDWLNSSWESISFEQISWLDRDYFSLGTYWTMRAIFTQSNRKSLSDIFKEVNMTLSNEFNKLNLHPNLDMNESLIQIDAKSSSLGINDKYRQIPILDKEMVKKFNI